MMPSYMKLGATADPTEAKMVFENRNHFVHIPPRTTPFWTGPASPLNEPKRIPVMPLAIDQGPPASAKFLARIAVRVEDKLVLVRLADVLWIQSDHNLLRLHLADVEYAYRMTMKDLHGQLDPDRFLRLHRNAIVNLDHVVDFELPRCGNAYVRLWNGQVLPISHAGRLELRHTLFPRASAAARA